MNYDATDGMKQAISVTNSSLWREVTVVVPDAAMRQRGPQDADLVLASGDGDTVFHLIEVEKLGD